MRQLYSSSQVFNVQIEGAELSTENELIFGSEIDLDEEDLNQ